MSVLYCSECGKKHEYSFAKPNFCSSCGGAFGIAKLKKSQKPDPDEEYDDEDEDDEDFEDDDGSFTNSKSVPNIRKIQVDIETAAQYNTFDLGSMFSSESNTAPRTSAPKRRNSPTSLEDFKQNKK
jgi:hypothetical protein